MVQWQHQFDGHVFEQALGVDDGQGSLVCSSPWGRKESDTTERLNQLLYIMSLMTTIHSFNCHRLISSEPCIKILLRIQKE